MTTPAHNARVNRQRHEMNLVKLIERFGSEDRCRDYLKTLRWPDGPECLRCKSKSLSWIKTRKQFDCNSCRYRFSVTAGTIFHDSHLPLWKWFLATYMMCESRKGVSANQLKRTLAVAYKTAWYLCHRIRAAMNDASAPPLRGIVEIDETFVGGDRKGVGSGYKGHKSMVIGAIQRGGPVRFKVDRQPSKVVIHSFVRDNVHGDTEAIYTDEARAYEGIADHNTRHETVTHTADEWVRADVHTNTVESVWSLFKRSLVGSYHQLSAKHLPAYLDEFAFRFNNRENPYLFRDTLIELIKAEGLPYRKLVDQGKTSKARAPNQKSRENPSDSGGITP